MYQIFEIRPTYCAITDGLIGSSAHPLPMLYRSERLARKLAGVFGQRDYDNCGDNTYVVVEYGQSPYTRRAWPMTAPADDFPF